MQINTKKIIWFLILTSLFLFFMFAPFKSLLRTDEIGGGSLYKISYNFSWVFSLIFIVIGIIIFSKNSMWIGALIGALMFVPVSIWILYISIFPSGEVGSGQLLIFVPIVIFLLGIPIAAIARYFWKKPSNSSAK